MSIHKTPSGRWAVRWRDGDRHRQKAFTLKADAEDYDLERQRARQRGAFAPVEPSGMDTVVLLREWVAEDGPGWARSNYVPRVNIIGNWIAPYLAGVPLRELGEGRIIVYRREILAAGCTRKQANRAVAILSAALTFAVRNGYIPENLARKVEPLTVHDQRPRARAIAVPKVEELRAAMPTPRDRAMVSVLFYCGLRPGELLALRWRDVGERTLTIERSYSSGQLKGTKTGVRRSVMLIAPVAAELRELRPVAADDDDLVAPQPNGGFLDLNNWRNRVWRKAVDAVGLGPDPDRGLKRLSPYDGRHSFASALIHEGRSVVEVSGQMGHASISTTLSRYAHLIEEARGGERVSLEEAVARTRQPAQDVRDLYAPGRRGHLRLVS